jgi:hypothetical protein
VFSYARIELMLYNINLYDGLINRTEVERKKSYCKFNLLTSSSGRKLFYDKLLIQAPQLCKDRYNLSIREPLTPTLLDFKLCFQRSDIMFGDICYEYK